MEKLDTAIATDKCENCRVEIPDYKRVCSKRCAGAIGGRKGTTGGFYANRELAVIAGKKGGRISRRRKARV